MKKNNKCPRRNYLAELNQNGNKLQINQDFKIKSKNSKNKSKD